MVGVGAHEGKGDKKGPSMLKSVKKKQKTNKKNQGVGRWEKEIHPYVFLHNTNSQHLILYVFFFFYKTRTVSSCCYMSFYITRTVSSCCYICLFT